MAKVPPTSQDITSCYADTAAYMSSAFIQANSSHKTHRTAPDMITAAVGAGNSQIENATTGRICNALQYIQQQGSCDKTALDNIVKKSADNPNGDVNWDDAINDECISAIANIRVVGGPVPKPQTPEQVAAHVAANFKNKLKFPKELIPDQNTILSILESQNPGLMVETESKLFCEMPGNEVQPGKDSPPLPQCQEYDFQNARATDGKKYCKLPQISKLNSTLC